MDKSSHVLFPPLSLPYILILNEILIRLKKLRHLKQFKLLRQNSHTSSPRGDSGGGGRREGLRGGGAVAWPRCSPESGPRPVRVVGQGACEHDGGRRRPGDEQVRALGDDADGVPGSHLHPHAVVTVHDAAFHLHLQRDDKGVTGAGRVLTGADTRLQVRGKLVSPSASSAPMRLQLLHRKSYFQPQPVTFVKINILLGAQGDNVAGVNESRSTFLRSLPLTAGLPGSPTPGTPRGATPACTHTPRTASKPAAAASFLWL